MWPSWCQACHPHWPSRSNASHAVLAMPHTAPEGQRARECIVLSSVWMEPDRWGNDRRTPSTAFTLPTTNACISTGSQAQVRHTPGVAVHRMCSLGSNVQITCADHATKHKVHAQLTRHGACGHIVATGDHVCSRARHGVRQTCSTGLVPLARLLHSGGNVSHSQPPLRRARGHHTRGVHMWTPQRTEEKSDGTDAMGTV
jgi:hypothetical protein